jgi:predicted Rossmann-fold nucleotide-binding protein
LFQRLHHLVTFADAWVALPGGIGTLSEVALTWSLMQVGEVARQPFVVVGSMWHELLEKFSGTGYVNEKYRELILYVAGIDEVPALLK